jgi:hypothetical protein
MTTPLHASETTLPYVHLKARVSRSDAVDGQLRAGSAVVVDLTSARQPIGVAVVVDWTEDRRFSALGELAVPPGVQSVTIKVSRAAPVAAVDIYGFASFGAYLQWLYPGIPIGNEPAIAAAIIGSGNPPKTAGDGFNTPPIVI